MKILESALAEFLQKYQVGDNFKNKINQEKYLQQVLVKNDRQASMVALIRKIKQLIVSQVSPALKGPL